MSQGVLPVARRSVSTIPITEDGYRVKPGMTGGVIPDQVRDDFYDQVRDDVFPLLLLSSWMRFIVNLGQVLEVEVGVYLRG